jgi:hypothetical protein
MLAFCTVLCIKGIEFRKSEEVAQELTQRQLQEEMQKQLPLLQKLSEEQKASGYKLMHYEGKMEIHQASPKPDQGKP